MFCFMIPHFKVRHELLSMPNVSNKNARPNRKRTLRDKIKYFEQRVMEAIIKIVINHFPSFKHNPNHKACIMYYH